MDNRRGPARGRRGAAYVVAFIGMLALVMSSALGAFGTGRAQAQAVKQFGIGTAVATNTNTSLSDQPAAGSTPLLQLPVNTRGMVLGGPFNEGWYWLEVGSNRGYVQDSQLVEVNENWTPIALETPRPADTAVPQRPTDEPAPPTAAGGTAQPTASATPSGSQPTQAVPTGTPDVLAPSTDGNYSNLWLAEMSNAGNVRSGPSLQSKVIKGWWVGRRVLLYQSATDDKGGLWYRVSDPPEEPMWVHASLISKVAPVQYEGARFKGKWININVTQQVVTAYQDGTPVKVTLASTGTGKNQTELGVWKIYYRLPKQDMKGGSLAAGDYYFLKDVPFPQYFHNSGEGLHGTYWHDDFGRPHSHGCVNLSTPMSEWFYKWDTIGTVVWVHK
ncbi:MAG TPA: L,D-transpeptidase family protein [Chloroflexia bacterium]